MPCPSNDRLAAALRGVSSSGDDAGLAAHLAECANCRARLDELAGGSAWVESHAKRARSSKTSELLRQTMRSLESHGAQEHDVNTSPKLDFLQPPSRPGDLGRFGAYDVLEHVASGGMGIVLKARDASLDRVVALKILPPTLAANALARARFVREARAAAAVVHEHIVPIYAVDEFAGLPYIVMQFVKGRTLSDRIRATGPLPVEEILRIGAQTAAGLAAAHAQGIIHRDVKPGNILLENSVERVKLTDFGLARAADEVGLTRTGELAGTPEFMSPEQADGGAVDHRSDLFSFGSVLYAMAAGRSPFQGESIVAVVRKVCDEQPSPVHEINRAIPSWLSDIIQRLMQKSPTARFQSAHEVGELLERYLARVQRGEMGGIPGMSVRAFVSPNIWRPYAIAASAVLVGMLILWAVLPRQAKSPPVPPASVLHSPFVVRDSVGAETEFSRIEDALEAAPAGGVVELCWNGPRELNPVRLPAKELTIRAGRDFRPKWISTDPSASVLSASAALTLENISLVLDASAARDPAELHPPTRGMQPGRISPSRIAVIAMTNGPLRVSRCTLEVRGGRGDTACVSLANAGSCVLESAFLFPRMEKGVVWKQTLPVPTKLALTNCVVFAAESVWPELNESAPAQLELERCTFGGPCSVCLSPEFSAANLEVRAQRNLFDTGSVIFDARTAGATAIPQWMRWNGCENLFSPARRYVVSAARGSDSNPATLDDWNRWWNRTNEASRQVQVAYVSGRSDANPRPGTPTSSAEDFRITELRVIEGPPLPRDEWSSFGADTASVGADN